MALTYIVHHFLTQKMKKVHNAVIYDRKTKVYSYLLVSTSIRYKHSVKTSLQKNKIPFISLNPKNSKFRMSQFIK